MDFLYILQSEKVGKTYIGITSQPFTRLDQHNEGKNVTFTKKYRPWKMVALFKIEEGLLSARAIEAFLKNQKSKILIDKLIQPEFEPKGKLAQLVRVPHVRD